MSQHTCKSSLDYVLNKDDEKKNAKHRPSSSTPSHRSPQHHQSRTPASHSPVPSQPRQPVSSPLSTAAASSSSSSSSRPPPEKSFVCHLCFKAFAEKGNLKKHISSVHYKEKLKVCPYPGCGKSFSFRDGLGRHIAHVHDNLRPHPCEECPKSFKQPSHLTKHMRTIHKTD